MRASSLTPDIRAYVFHSEEHSISIPNEMIKSIQQDEYGTFIYIKRFKEPIKIQENNDLKPKAPDKTTTHSRKKDPQDSDIFEDEMPIRRKTLTYRF